MTTLTTTQRSALGAINHKHMTTSGLVKELGVARALAQNLLDTLVKAGFAKKYESGQYTPTDAGKAYLRGDAVPEKAVFTVGNTRGVPSKRQNKQATNNSSADMALLENLDSGPGEIQLLHSVQAAAFGVFEAGVNKNIEPTAEEPQTEKQALPNEIDIRLSELEQKLTTKIITPRDIDLKLQVLHRIGALLHPTIADVLDAIADDLQRVQQVAVDVSKAA